MNKFLLTLFCLIVAFSIHAETVYKKVNPDGSVEFTDTGSKDSEEIKIRKPKSALPLAPGWRKKKRNKSRSRVNEPEMTKMSDVRSVKCIMSNDKIEEDKK